jgi:hypothetical protein
MSGEAMREVPDIYSETKVWAWAEHAESERWEGSYATREEAEASHDGGFVAECSVIIPENVARAVADVDDLLERMDQYDDLFGAFDDPVFEVENRPAAQADLEEAIAAWAKQHLGPLRPFLVTGDPMPSRRSDVG